MHASGQHAGTRYDASLGPPHRRSLPHSSPCRDRYCFCLRWAIDERASPSAEPAIQPPAPRDDFTVFEMLATANFDSRVCLAGASQIHTPTVGLPTRWFLISDQLPFMDDLGRKVARRAQPATWDDFWGCVSSLTGRVQGGAVWCPPLFPEGQNLSVAAEGGVCALQDMPLCKAWR